MKAAATTQPQPRAGSPAAGGPAASDLGWQSLERALLPALDEDFLGRCRRAYMALERDGETPHVLGVTSSLRGESRTTVAFAMAQAIAVDTREPTALVELDLEKVRAAETCYFWPTPGLTEWVFGEAPLRAVPAAGLENLQIVPAGAVPGSPTAVVYQLGRGDWMEQLRKRFRHVVLLLPPTLHTPFSRLASDLADQVVIVMRYGSTPLYCVEEVKQMIGPDRVGGVILNNYAPRVGTRTTRISEGLR